MEKCRHDAAIVEGTYGRLTIEKCETLCQEYFVSVLNERGLTHTYTADELAALTSRIATLEAALRPIQTCETLYTETQPDETWLNAGRTSLVLTLGDLRRAADALKGNE